MELSYRDSQRHELQSWFFFTVVKRQGLQGGFGVLVFFISMILLVTEYFFFSDVQALR